MVDFELTQNVLLITLTIAASVLRLATDAILKLGRDSFETHGIMRP